MKFTRSAKFALAAAASAVPVPDPAEQRIRREARLASKN
jgi:hypothetical protein